MMNLMTPKILFKINEWIANNKVIKFYKSIEWKQVRAFCLIRDKFECQRCKREGRQSKADMVHHINHLKTQPNDALNSDNCTSLCNSCHNLEHPEKFGKVSKKKFWVDERW